jgi:uncharacterized membrane protein SirB2
LLEFAQWLGSTSLSVALQSHTWLIALLQGLHIVMIGVVFVSMLMIARRIAAKVRTEETLEGTWQRFAPWMWRGLVVMLATGLLMAFIEPVRQVSAISFWIKMVLVIVAVVLTTRLRRLPSRALAYSIIGLLVVVIFLGRFIAYDGAVWGY